MNLSPITITRNSLASEITRNFIGESVFDELARYSSSDNNSSIGTIFKVGSKFFGFLAKAALSFIDWTFGGLWDLVVQTYYELKYYDWNQSDEEIKQQIKSNNQQLVQSLGRLIGSGTVWVITIGVSAGLSVQYPVLAGRVALALAEEGGQEIKGQLTSFLSTSTETLTRNLIMSTHIGIRRIIREINKNNKRTKPYLLQKKVKKVPKKVPNDFFKDFGTGFSEGVEDAIIESGYIVAYTLDDYYMSQREAIEASGGPVRTIEVFPDARNTDESIILHGTQETVTEQVQTYLATHQGIANRDVGIMIGQPYDDWHSARLQGRKILLEFDEKQFPPFKKDGKSTRRVQITIPNVKAGITWNKLKTLIPKFTWGPHLAHGIFDTRREMWVYGSTENEATNTLNIAASLSMDTLIDTGISHKTSQNKSRKKVPTVVYLVYASMLVRIPTVGANDYQTIDGKNRKMIKTRWEMWHENKPENLDPFP